MAMVKGSALGARFRWAEAVHGEAGLKKLLAALAPEDRKIHADVILPSAWYPFGTFVRVIETADRVFGKGDLGLVPEIARWAADANLTTFYRFFYQLGSTSFILGMGSRLWRMNYDAGELQVDARNGTASLRIADWPEPHRIHCLSVMAWCVRSAEISGAKDVHAELRTCRASGDTTCEMGLTWSEE